MKKLTKQQEDLLILVGRNKSKSISEVGRIVYSTNKSCYDVIYDFQERGWVELINYKNKLLPKITIKGEKQIKQIQDSRYVTKK